MRELLKREIGEIIRREIPVVGAGLISVNEVAVAPDLHTAMVFVSVLGKPEQQRKGVVNSGRTAQTPPGAPRPLRGA